MLNYKKIDALYLLEFQFGLMFAFVAGTEEFSVHQLFNSPIVWRAYIY